MNRTWAIRLTAVVVLLAGVVLLTPTASRAATIESGWWSRLNTGSRVEQSPAPPLDLPAPPPAPPEPPNAEGGLQVAALPDGALSIAAVRVDQELTSLTLRVAPDGDANGESARLVACAAVSPWVPVLGGPWDAKPMVACDVINGGGSVAGIRSDDGSFWTFPVAPLASEGGTDVVILPLATSDAADGAVVPFQLVFVPPAASDLVIAPSSDQPDGAGDAGGGAGESFEDSFTDSSTDTFSDSSTFDPSFAAGGAANTPVVSPALNDDEQAPVLPRFAAATARDTASQVVGAAMVLLALGLFFMVARQPTPPIHTLVGANVGREIPAVKPQLGGLGRFVTARVGRPPALH